jgi:hypothetical protein
MFNK